MTRKTTTIFINISLLLIVIVSGAVAVYLRDRLPSHSISQSAPDTEFDKNEMVDSIGLESMAFAENDSAKNISAEVETESGAASSSEIYVKDVVASITFPEANIQKMQSASHPFAAEAKKVLSGKLQLADSISRRKILNYCEHFRTAYNTKDIDFIKQVLSEDALIIVGHTVKTSKENMGLTTTNTFKYSVRSKQEYIRNLSAVFAANKKIAVDFSNFKILRHPTLEGIYGVTLRQKYQSDLYSDDGFLFLLWDFRNPSMPMIHVRTWQPSETLSDEDDIIDIGDFNLE